MRAKIFRKGLRFHPPLLGFAHEASQFPCQRPARGNASKGWLSHRSISHNTKTNTNMIEIHYILCESRVRCWQPGWAPDCFEIFSIEDFDKFKTLARSFHIQFVNKTDSED